MAYPESKLGKSGVTRKWNVQLTASSWSLLVAEIWWLPVGTDARTVAGRGWGVAARRLQCRDEGRAGTGRGVWPAGLWIQAASVSPCSESVFSWGDSVFLHAHCLQVHPAQEQPLSHESWLSLKPTLRSTYLRPRAVELDLPGLPVPALPLTSFVTLGYQLIFQFLSFFICQVG